VKRFVHHTARKNLLKAIERATRQPVSPLELPTIQTVNNVRIARFKDQISTALAEGGLDEYTALIEAYEQEHNIPAIEIAAALAKMARGDEPLLLDKNRREVKNDDSWRDERPSRSDRGERPSRDRGEREERGARREHSPRVAEPGMQTYRIVGHEHGVKPGNIVGAIANEAKIESKFIGRIDIYDDYTILDLPDNLPAETLDHLKSVRVAGQSFAYQCRKSRCRCCTAARPARAGAEPRAERAPRIADSAPGSRLNQVVDRATSKEDEQHVRRKRKRQGKVSIPMQTYRIEVGKADAVTPANIVGAIANEAG
jgi:ATP-dependent RNA helicase DeaD